MYILGSKYFRQTREDQAVCAHKAIDRYSSESQEQGCLWEKVGGKRMSQGLDNLI